MPLKFRSLLPKTERSCTQKSESCVTSSKFSMVEEHILEGAMPLSAVAEAFEELSAVVKAKGFGYDLDLKPFCDSCSLVSVLFGCLGIAFRFAQSEYCNKVSDLAEASENYGTLNNILDYDVQNGTVRSQGSLSRNLRRVRQGLDLIRALFRNFLSSEDSCLRVAASSAYGETCAEYHTWAVRTAVYAGMYALPTREQLLMKLNETDESAEREMIRYINASLPVIIYIDKLYTSRNINLDWGNISLGGAKGHNLIDLLTSFSQEKQNIIYFFFGCKY